MIGSCYYIFSSIHFVAKQSVNKAVSAFESPSLHRNGMSFSEASKANKARLTVAKLQKPPFLLFPSPFSSVLDADERKLLTRSLQRDKCTY